MCESEIQKLQWKPQCPSNIVFTITNKITFPCHYGSEDSPQAASVTVSSPNGGSFHVTKSSGPRVMLNVCYLWIKFLKLHGFHFSQFCERAHVVHKYCMNDNIYNKQMEQMINRLALKYPDNIIKVCCQYNIFSAMHTNRNSREAIMTKERKR